MQKMLQRISGITILMKGIFLTCLTVTKLYGQSSLDLQINKELPSLIRLYEQIHTSPELSHYEEKTSTLAAKDLKSLGFSVIENLGKYTNETWKGFGIAGVLKNGEGPVVLIRAELDALPVEEKTMLLYASKIRATLENGLETGVMHACGHDLHLTNMIGTARILVSLKKKWKGTLILIGEPAEETADGVKALLSDGLYDKVPRPDYLLALHDVADLEVGKVGVTAGYAFANSAVVEVTIRGKGGTAARSQDAKDPIVIASQFIMAVQVIVSRETSPLTPASITVGSIHGGNKANVIPEEVKLLLSVRALNDEVFKKLLSSIQRTAKGIAIAAGIPEDRAPIINVSKNEITTSTYNDPALTDRLTTVLNKVLGSDNVVKIAPRMAGDTFGDYCL